MTTSSDYDPRYLSGIEYFNECEFFEAHEVWEDLWSELQGPARRFFQGLIQVAVCLHHFGNGNLRGARKLYHSSRGYLADYAPSYQGLDVSQFLGQLERCCAQMLVGDEPASGIELQPELIPEIHLDPPSPTTGVEQT
jgi:predicted metal-dependent hydrolase